MDKERTEDLNPRSDDVEQKVKRMLDPSMPDEPAQPSPAAGTKKTIPIQSVSAPAKPKAQEDALPSAPELPQDDKKSAKNSKKVIIPISHHDEKSESSAGADAETAPLVKQIAITQHEGGAEAVADKLNQKIAELDAKDPGLSANPPATASVAEGAPVEGETETPIIDSAAITNPETDKAVEAIVAAEGDELLEVEDAVRDTDEPLEPAKKSRRGPLQILKSWWAKPGFKKAVIIFAAVAITAAGAFPGSRYFLLNSAGVRASSSLIVLDESTQQPLKNVAVSIGKSTGVTDEAGRVSLRKVKLGKNPLVIEKRAFAPITKNVVVGWGSNPLGDFKLTPTGSQYSFSTLDFLSGKPLSKVEATSGEASAVSDSQGAIKLTIDRADDGQFKVKLQADGFRTEEISVDPNDKSVRSVKLVPARKQVFVSKRSGKYDIYSVYIDGKEENLVLAGSGNEKEGMVLVPHPNEEIAAYVSTRAGQHNSDGFLLSNLILLNLEDNSTTNVGVSERIQIVDWSGDRLIYVQIAAGSSGDSPGRYRLMSYNYKDASNKELASSNFFNDVIAVSGSIYYAPSSAYQTGKTNFYKINADGSNQQTIFDQEVWNIFRTSYDHFALSVQQQWYDYRLGDKSPTKLSSAPASQISRVYINSPDAKHSIWADNRDGKGVLLSYDTAGQKEDATVRSQSGLGYPVRWLNNSSLVYRVKTDQETADYAISIDGGEPVKIRDVTNTSGIDRWYY